MSDNELGMILAYIEAAKDEKELQAMTDALEKRKEQLAKEADYSWGDEECDAEEGEKK